MLYDSNISIKLEKQKQQKYIYSSALDLFLENTSQHTQVLP